MAQRTRRVAAQRTISRGRTYATPAGDYIRRLGSRITPKPNGCWAYNDDLDTYGQFLVRVEGKRYKDQAHRVVYREIVGPIEDDMHLHHECQNPGCVNPAHLVPLTPAEHAQRHVELRKA